MMELIVICTLHISGGFFFGGVAHTEYVLTRSQAHCAQVAEERGVSPHFVGEETIWFDKPSQIKHLIEVCGWNLADCQLAFNIPVEWRESTREKERHE